MRHTESQYSVEVHSPAEALMLRTISHRRTLTLLHNLGQEPIWCARGAACPQTAAVDSQTSLLERDNTAEMLVKKTKVTLWSGSALRWYNGGRHQFLLFPQEERKRTQQSHVGSSRPKCYSYLLPINLCPKNPFVSCGAVEGHLQRQLSRPTSSRSTVPPNL